MLPPLPRCSGWAYSSLFSPSRVSLPRKGRRVGLHIVLFEACSAFTHVAACTLARPPIRGPLYRRLQPFRHLHDCSGCFRLERLPGGTRTHWKAPPFHGAHPKRSLGATSRDTSLALQSFGKTCEIGRWPLVIWRGMTDRSANVRRAVRTGSDAGWIPRPPERQMVSIRRGTLLLVRTDIL
jgi:hypothetical protein